MVSVIYSQYIPIKIIKHPMSLPLPGRAQRSVAMSVPCPVRVCSRRPWSPLRPCSKAGTETPSGRIFAAPCYRPKGGHVRIIRVEIHVEIVTYTHQVLQVLEMK